MLSKITPDETTKTLLWDREGDVREIPWNVFWDALTVVSDLSLMQQHRRIDSVPEVFISWDQTMPRLADMNVRFNPRPSVG